MSLGIVAAIAAGWGVNKVVSHFQSGRRRKYLSPAENATACNFVHNAFSYDNDEEPLSTSEDSPSPQSLPRQGYAGRVAREIKAKLGGTPRATAANRLMVQRLVADLVKEHGVRPSHAMEIIPLAVALVFIPMVSERAAQRLLACTYTEEALDDMELEGHQGQYAWYDLRRWCGGKRLRSHRGVRFEKV